VTAAPAPVLTFRSQTWSQRLWQDLQPTPGRLAASLRIVLATLIALVLMMALQLPFASLGLYYIFLVVRESPAVSVRSGVVAILTLVLAVAAELAVVIVTDNDPMARLLSVAIASFIAGTLMAASTMPALASIWGFIYCTLIALWERPAPADALVRASLYLIATVTLAFLCSVAVEYVFAFRHAADRLADQLRLRHQTLEKTFTLFATGAPASQLAAAIPALNRLAATGQRPMLELYNAVIERGLDTHKLPIGSRVQIAMLAQLMDTAAAFASHYPAGVDADMRLRCAELARLCRERTTTHEALPAVLENPSLLDRVEAALHDILSMPARAAGSNGNAAGSENKEDEELVAPPAANVPFLIPGALKNKDTVAFALKLTLCVMVCYIFYFAVAWPGISTSVTTVFIAAIGTTAAIKQKLVNRFLGSAIGGGIAILATAFLFPHMDSITSLVVLIAVVAFGSAWWACGRQFGYAGLQIAFSFYLVAFEGFSAPTELAPARDRLVGILVALVVIWLVFDQLWPVRTVTAMRRALVAVLRSEARFLRVFESPAPRQSKLHQIDALRDQIAKTIAGLRTMNDMVVFEFGADREAHTRISENILQTALTAVPFFWNQLAVLHNEQDRDFLSEPGLIEMRRKAAAGLDEMAQAVAENSVFIAPAVDDIADPSILASARYGEYARNTVAAHQDLQHRVSTLQAGG
jgi:multidrug resistance protein MdtO